MKYFLLLLTVLVATNTFSQSNTFEISGTLTSEDDKIPLESATVYLQRVKDSSLITYTISDQKGRFLLGNKIGDNQANLYVSYVGYQTYQKLININKSKIDLGNISLKISTNALDEVIVKSQAPITIKKDTLEFNVKSFKTKKDASIEDLLKELPGVEVDPDGKIKVNGKEVNKVLVNGKPFFGNDPTIATRNLSKEIIEKIQVSDTKTDEEAFAGEEGDRSNKTVNLVVKKENNKGVFGRLAAGAGTDKTYEYAGMYNRFNDDLRFSVLVGGNNINSPGFSFGEIRKMFGGSSSYNINKQVFNYGNDGIITSRNVGLNYVDDWGKKADASTNYFASNSDLENIVKSERENILPDSRFFTNLNSKTISNTERHSTETKVKIKVDSTLLITIEPKFRYIKTTNDFNSDEKSFDENSVLINESTSKSFKETTENFFSNNINLTKRLGTKGAFFKLDIFNRSTKTDTENILNNQVDIYGNGLETITLNQLREVEGNDNTFIISSSYRLPIKGKELSLDIGFGYRNNTQKNIRNSYDFNDLTQDYETSINEDLSSDFEYANITKTPKLTLEYKKKKWSGSFNADFVFRTLENTDYLRPEFNLKRNFNAVVVKYRLNYRSPKSSLGLGYNLSNNAPSLSQLQTFIDVTNPLDIIVGNPELKPSNRHNFYMYFNKNNFQKGIGFNTYLSSDILNNNAVAKRSINEDLIRETTYTNIDGGYTFQAYMDFNKKVKIDSLKTVQLNLGFNPNIRRSVNFNNDVQYASLSKTLSPNLGARFMWKDVAEFGVNYSLSFTNNTFDTDVFDNQEFSYHSMFIRTINYFNKKFDWRNEIRYNYNPDIADDFEKSAWFWNSTLAYSFMKDKATLTLKAYDLLNQNTNARRIANQNFIEDRQSTVLQRYFMLSFSWKFNTLGKAGEVKGGNGYYIVR
ncbi:outer membrane beta-barrel protein [Flavivirga aquimarina]|uniref:Outer membrane beta-barrel protein n=1 Tax=Flavivirga aquimarina TaxID=2027862 RepID=A0ABT8W5K8_9FLAO|nr:outer membrane beta-barrel protein [Flavivirga aquimarina]MDO5968399.1 outer membrane beta-barrel protein [Flavivirga aquimarina]